MEERKSLLGTIVTWTIVGILAIVAFKVITQLLGFVMGILGIALGVVAFLLFTVGPIILVGWLAIKAWKAVSREPAL